MRCQQCQMLTINGVACHETGCPIAWQSQMRECKECGCEFQPCSRFAVDCPDCVAAELTPDQCDQLDALYEQTLIDLDDPRITPVDGHWASDD